MFLTFDEIRTNLSIKTYIKKADETLSALGFTEHSFPHVLRVSDVAGKILKILNYSEHDVELVKIAGYMHDIGNLVNRVDHAQSGALMAFRILDKLGMDTEDIADVVSAIGNHDEGTAVPINAIAAALILADKSDVRRSRVRNRDITSFDIHDRVNYSVKSSNLVIDENKKTITLVLDVDTEFGSVMDYFEIFLGRMILCRKAAENLGLHFKLNINGQHLI
ncbi:MAG: HD domain-containing protein [Clostridia bacterium]|nr:HD domain-containing protein [Clostridia bacterium]